MAAEEPKRKVSQEKNLFSYLVSGYLIKSVTICEFPVFTDDWKNQEKG